MVTHQS